MALWLVLAASLLTSECYADEAYSLQQVARSNVHFANALYEIVSAEPGNVLLSPFSIQTIIALTYLGARGSTAQQMEDGLRLPGDQEVTKTGFRLLIRDLLNSADVSLSVANKIYLDNRFVPNTSFLQTAQQFFNSALENANFRQNSDAVRRLINSWVEVNTNGKIQDLLPPGLVGASTTMVLVNAVYFKASWPWFEERKTAPKPFYVNGLTPVTVSMMYSDQYFNYKDSPTIGVQVLELSYNGGEVSLIVILPYMSNGIVALEEMLSEINLSDLTADMYSTKVRVFLPRFLLQQSLDLEDTLTKLGMTDMFGNDADFSGISKQAVAVSKVVHKAYIEVNEKGVEAAAATGVGIMLLSAPINPTTFNADHPFIFLLRHNPTEAILFMGRYAEPEASDQWVKTQTTARKPGKQWSYYCR